jgi:acetyltransferase-like isoleucine patch superfamily enzyme
VKALFKLFANLLAAVIVAPAGCGWLLMRRVTRRDFGFATLVQSAALLPGKTGVYLRRALYRWCLNDAGNDCEIGFGTLLTSPETSIGERVYIGPYCMLGAVTIERDVLVASHVSILNGGRQHGTGRLDLAMRDQPGEYPRVTIGAGAWLGERSIVMCDVGRHCIVGAGAVVTQPLPDYAVAVGVPARIVRYRDEMQEPSEESLDSPKAVLTNG